MEITRESLKALPPSEAIDILFALVQRLIEENTALKAEIAELKARLNQDSNNSSKPPSSDPPWKKSKQPNMREKSGKKPGGQQGHKGSGLILPKNPDKFIAHEPRQCETCANRTSCETDRSRIASKRYEIDTEVITHVTEHQQIRVKCPKSGKVLLGEYPTNIRSESQYGVGYTSLVASLNTIGAVSMERIQELLHGITGISPSTGTIANMMERSAEAVSGKVAEIKAAVAEARVVNFDETGVRIGGNTEWLHVASTEDWTYLSVQPKRGKEGMDKAEVLPAFTGTAVHDCWSPYFTYDAMNHALCNAHLLRELKAATENYGQGWATEASSLLLEMKQMKESLQREGETKAPSELWLRYSTAYDEIMAQALLSNPKPEPLLGKKGRPKRGKIGALVDRMTLHKEEFLAFFVDFDIPFTNNQAERDIRMFKVKQKVSGCFRSRDGATGFATLMSFIGTAKKRGLSAFASIRDALLGDSFSLPVIIVTE